MNNLVGLDWMNYFHSLSDDETRRLATWLVAERLGVGEFMEVVDRAHARIAEGWHEQPSIFVAWYGRTAAEEYARRKRRFAALMEALEDARMTGALPGDVAPDELDVSQPHWADAPSVERVLGALEYARRGSE